MTIDEAVREGQKALSGINLEEHERWVEARALLGIVLDKNAEWLVAHGTDEISLRQKKSFTKLLERRKRHEPLAYIRGRERFLGRWFTVNRHVLIPRPETEELVRHVEEHLCHDRNTEHVVWDVGTGSGVIAITLANLFPTLDLIASDVSARALSVAKKNARALLNDDRRIKWLKGSLMTNEIARTIVSRHPDDLIIVANLPYLPLSDRTALSRDVVDYEPSKALFAERDGNALIFRLLRQLERWRKTHHLELLVFLECDPPQAHVIAEEAQKLFPTSTIDVLRDSSERERLVRIRVMRKHS